MQLLGSMGPRNFPMRGDLLSKPYAYRYLPAISQDTWVQVGAWGRFADQGLTPFWILLHRDDKGPGGFQDALRRLMASELSLRIRRDEGHAWVPLDVPEDANGPELIRLLTQRVEDVLAILKP